MAATLTTLGMNQLLDAGVHGDTAVGTWYIGLIDNTGYTAYAEADTAAKITETANPPTTNGWQEATEYDEANRIAWSEGAASSGVTTGAGAAVFTISGTVTIRGAFLISNNTKGGTTGILLGMGDFAGTKSCADDDTLAVTVTLTLTDNS